MRRCLAPPNQRSAGRKGWQSLLVAVTALVLGVAATTLPAAAQTSTTSSSTTSTTATSTPGTTATTAPASTTTSSTSTSTTSTTAPGATTSTTAPAAAPQATNTPSAGWVTGPDVSSWQHVNGGPIDWNAVKAAGNSFVFIKATEGASSAGGSPYTNPYFASDFANAAAAGLYRGAYHFARPQLPISTAADQARQFAAAVGNLGGALDLPPVLDLEVTGGLGPTDLTNWTLTFLQTVQSVTGRVPMVYTGRYFVQDSMGSTTALGRYPLWVASWTSSGDPGTLPAGWGSWNFWQYTDAASVPGISGAVDLNRFSGDLATLATQGGQPLQLFERFSPTSGFADRLSELRVPAFGTYLACDWNGDGIDTPTLFSNGVWFSNDSPSGGGPTIAFGYGNPGDIPVCGDWNGTGRDAPGVFRNGSWYLASSIGSGATYQFGYGNPGDVPVVGDWNGDGRDTPGVFRNGWWYLSNGIGAGATYQFGYGNPTDRPVVGDWTGAGHDTVGIVRGGWWYLSPALGAPYATTVFGYGNPDDVALPGRWTGRATGPGVARRAGG